MPKQVQSVTYTNDQGVDCFAFVVSEDDEHLNLAVLDPDTYALHAANAVPKNSDRVK